MPDSPLHPSEEQLQARIEEQETLTSEAFRTTEQIELETPELPPIPPLPEITLTPQQEKEQELGEKIITEQEKLRGETEFRVEQREEFEIPEQRKAFQELSAQLKSLQAEAKAIPIQLQQENIGLARTRAATAVIQFDRLRVNAINALTVSATLEATRGNLAFALDQVDRAVAAKFDPIKEGIRIDRLNYDIIADSPLASVEQQNLARKLAAEDRKREKVIETEEKNYEEILTIGVEAASDGADAIALRDIRKLLENPTSENVIEAQRLAAKAIPEVADLTGTTADLRTFATLNPDLEVGTPEFQTGFNKFVREQAGLKRPPETPEGVDFATGRQFVIDNPDFSRAELKAGLFENLPDLDISEVNAILDAAGITEEKIVFTSDQLTSIARAMVKGNTKLFKGGEVERAREQVEAGILEINGKTIELSARQKQALLSAIDTEFPEGSRSVIQRILPKGK